VEYYSSIPPNQCLKKVDTGMCGRGHKENTMLASLKNLASKMWGMIKSFFTEEKHEVDANGVITKSHLEVSQKGLGTLLVTTSAVTLLVPSLLVVALQAGVLATFIGITMLMVAGVAILMDDKTDKVVV